MACFQNAFCLLCRYYNNKVRKSPHVVGHYAAGARLIGLTEKQMAKHLATLSASGGDNQDSPYAQPLCLFATNFPRKVVSKRRTGHGRIKLTVVKGGLEQDHPAPTTTTTEHTTTEHNTEKHTTPMTTQPAVSQVTQLLSNMHARKCFSIPVFSIWPRFPGSSVSFCSHNVYTSCDQKAWKEHEANIPHVIL